MFARYVPLCLPAFVPRRAHASALEQALGFPFEEIGEVGARVDGKEALARLCVYLAMLIGHDKRTQTYGPD